MINKDKVKSIYKDAHIKLDENKLDEITEKFSKLIEYNSILFKADVEGLEGTCINTENEAYFREDVPVGGMDREKALSYANDREYGYFRLQRVLD
ncbi:Asp-tRNA(Asn)/Glu-tRNA(Gln) amidotransferase subunit GatC [Microaceticoccus formicicus]|uniref:Asp-tRNA(Asn)/Glu-tRNA(Gln) amidotransferase subunit GatC n=1 Tax=Microaceticoccus formicicus TaxID=3118105 RepID=UPI003CD00C2A|nr:Asp-tRNA(Asn)/Glu-tRNA(Gln) amidotransferase subunit GatC [Peptoniphilaceae bacterium AMB_02]